MPRRTIPPKDKEKVKRNLIAGKSNREAVIDDDGRELMHHSNVTKLRTSDFSDIQQLRAVYISLLRDKGANEDFRAKEWVAMAKSNDMNAKYKALVYIDELMGITQKEKDDKPVTPNVLVVIQGNNDTPEHRGSFIQLADDSLEG